MTALTEQISNPTDEEVICAWMEQKPGHNPEPFAERWPFADWWMRVNGKWAPIPLTLNDLWNVEERLTDEQWSKYYRALLNPDDRDVNGRRVASRSNRAMLHATAAQKIHALAAVLRGAQ